MSFFPAAAPASVPRSSARSSGRAPPGTSVARRGTAAPPPKPSPETVAANDLVSSLNGSCGVHFYRAVSGNAKLSNEARRLCTVLAIVIARTDRTEVATMRFQVAAMARAVLGTGAKNIGDVFARWFDGDDVDLLTEKADLMTKLSSARRVDAMVRDLAWCHISKSCPLNAQAIKIAEAWVNRLTAERPSEEVFNHEIDTWWPDFNEA